MGQTPGREEIIELAEEQLRVSKRGVERGRVVIRTLYRSTILRHRSALKRPWAGP